MRKNGICVLAVSICILALLPACLFADGTSFGFGIVWQHSNVKYSTLSIMDSTGGSLPENTEGHKLKELSEVSSSQDVAILRYSTNVLGTHRLEYRATPLVLNTDSSSKKGYTFSFRIGNVNDGTAATLVVGTENAYYESEQGENSSSITYLTYSSISGSATSDVWVHMDIADAEEMLVGNWSASVVITGYGP